MRSNGIEGHVTHGVRFINIICPFEGIDGMILNVESSNMSRKRNFLLLNFKYFL